MDVILNVSRNINMEYLQVLVLAVSILMLLRLVLSSLQTSSRACVSLSVHPLAINAVRASMWTITISHDHVVGAYARVGQVGSGFNLTPEVDRLNSDWIRIHRKWIAM